MTDIRRRDFLSFCTGLGASALLPGCLARPTTASSGQQQQPNFLILFADDLGIGDLACEGNTQVRTPNIDALAGESVRFRNFFVQACCAPSRAALLTGRAPHKAGTWGVHQGRANLNLDEHTFAEHLSEAGYETFVTGKWHNGSAGPWHPAERGFNQTRVASYSPYYREMESYSQDRFTFAGWRCDQLVNLTSDFMSHNRNQPFCAYLPFVNPHTPWKAPQPLIDSYKAQGLSDELSLYYAVVEHMDKNIGVLLKNLELFGLDKNTVVIFCSDNGGTHGKINNEADWTSRNPQGYRGEKGDIWDLGVRSPLYIRYPAGFEPQTVKTNTCIEDMYPTLLDLADIPLPLEQKPLDGRSIVPLLNNGDRAVWQERYICQTHFDPYWEGKTEQHDMRDHKKPQPYILEKQSLTIRDERYKLCQVGPSFDHSDRNFGHIDGYKRGPLYQLYDTIIDHGETNNIANQHPEIVERMRTTLHAWYAPVIAQSETLFQPPVYPIGYLPSNPDAPTEMCCNLSSSTHVVNGIRGRFGVKPKWKDAHDSIHLQARVLRSGTYAIRLHAIHVKDDCDLEIRVGGQVLTRSFAKQTGSFIPFGELQLEKCDLTEIALTLTRARTDEKAAIKKAFWVGFTPV